MECGEEPTVDDAINEIAALLAAAYQRRARIRLFHSATEGLANTGEESVHELTLTGERKESSQQ
jgi:hypothetical protein